MMGQIVVGWTDSAEGHSALDWGVHQTLLSDRTLVVVHDYSQDSLGGGAGEQDQQDGAHGVRTALEQIVSDLGIRFPDLDLRSTVESDDPATGLLRWSAQADILVVGAMGRRHPPLMGALTDHLAAAALCPVALIPAGWQPISQSHRIVLVGATSTSAGLAALRFASREAELMGAELHAVVGADRLTPAGLAVQAHLDLLAAAESRLTVEIHWADGDPAETLINLSRWAQLVVVGAHHSSDPWSIRLGPVTDKVVSHAHCPVITVAREHAGAFRTRNESAPQAV